MGCVPSIRRDVRNKYGDEFASVLEAIWQKSALPQADTVKLQHFLRCAEQSPQAARYSRHADNQEEHLFEFVCKLALYAPEEWYEVLTDLPRPEAVRNNYQDIGVAFDASSRLRRAGIEYYHSKLTDRMASQVKLEGPRVFYAGSSFGDDQYPCLIGKLPEPPHRTTRVVAVSDTHLYHRRVELPRGDFLIHAGDLGYEESRSRDAELFDSYREGRPELFDQNRVGPPPASSFRDFFEWFSKSGLQLADALAWLKEQSCFKYRVLVGGNHDYVLEQLGPETAKKLCQRYDVTYLHTKMGTEVFAVDNAKVTIWGSGLSFMAEVGGDRAIKSGNNAFQLSEEEGKAELAKIKKELSSSKDSVCTVDIIVTHTPPKGSLLGKSGAGSEALLDLIQHVRPMLHICGHAHKRNDPLKDTWANLDGTLGVNAAVVGTWNHKHGLPVVIDMPLRHELPRSSCQALFMALSLMMAMAMVSEVI